MSRTRLIVVAACAVVVLAALWVPRVFTVDGAAAADSYEAGRSEALRVLDGLPVPSGAAPTGDGLGGDRVQPIDAEEAVAGYRLRKNPIAELFCMGSCPTPWSPSEGVSISRNLTVAGMEPAEMCAFFDDALPGSAGRAPNGRCMFGQLDQDGWEVRPGGANSDGAEVLLMARSR